MNIVEAYKKFNSQLIVLVSGYSGTHKSKIAKFIGKIFNLKCISLKQFYYPNYDTSITVASGENNNITLIDYDDIYRSVDWKKLNKYVKENNNIVICGFGFPSELITFKTDFHIYLKINKQKLFENMDEYIKKRDIKDRENAKLIFNKITFNHNEKLMKDGKIDKFVNLNEMSFEETKKSIFDYLIFMIDKWLNENKKK